MSKFALTMIIATLATGGFVFADDQPPTQMVFNDTETTDTPEQTIEKADKFWASGDELRAIELYNSIIDDEEIKDKKSKAKAMLRKCFLHASLEDIEKSIEGTTKLLDEEKSKKFFKKAKKYTKLIANAGDKEIVKKLIIQSSSMYLDKLLTTLLDDETTPKFS